MGGGGAERGGGLHDSISIMTVHKLIIRLQVPDMQLYYLRPGCFHACLCMCVSCYSFDFAHSFIQWNLANLKSMGPEGVQISD